MIFELNYFFYILIVLFKEKYIIKKILRRLSLNIEFIHPWWDKMQFHLASLNITHLSKQILIFNKSKCSFCLIYVWVNSHSVQALWFFMLTNFRKTDRNLLENHLNISKKQATHLSKRRLRHIFRTATYTHLQNYKKNFYTKNYTYYFQSFHFTNDQSGNW